MRTRVNDLCSSVVGPAAADVDEYGHWPEAGMRALMHERLTALTAPVRMGGLGAGLLGLVVATESLGRACSSTAMCFGMHCVATAVIAAKADARKDEQYLLPIARGEHLSTLALSETGTGSFFFLPETRLRRESDAFVVNGTKEFVTNGGHADSYVVSTVTSVPSEVGDFTCLVVDRDSPGLTWGETWRGLGMRGNASRQMKLDGTSVPVSSLLGVEGDQVWFVFEVVAPYFLMAMAGTYLGVAQAALTLATDHVRTRRFNHSAASLSDSDIVQHRIGELWTNVEKSRALVYHAAAMGDAGHPEALGLLLASKADVARTAVDTTNEALSLCGGMAYRENGTLARLLRDARASHVMSPTTDLLTLWTGRNALGMSLL